MDEILEQLRLARDAGRHDETLRLILQLYEQAQLSSYQDGYLFISMHSWGMLADVYAPARAAMALARDEQVRLLLAGDAYFGEAVEEWSHSRFRVIKGMNDKLGDSRSTYALFVQLASSQPKQAQIVSFVAMPAILEAKDFALAERYARDPFKWLTHLNDEASCVRLFPASGAPRLATELGNFIKDVRHLAAVHDGLGRPAEAEALRRAALGGLKSDELRDWAARELARPGTINDEISWRQMGLTVRYTTEDDWQQLKQVRLAALKDAPTAFAVSHATASEYTDDQWRERAAGKGAARFLLAFIESKAFGMVAHVPASAADLNLIAMWVTPDFRGAPVATRLVEAVKAHAIEHGYERVLLDVAPDNLRAVGFYQKLGFSFLPEWEPLESHPHIQLQKMAWLPAG